MIYFAILGINKLPTFFVFNLIIDLYNNFESIRIFYDSIFKNYKQVLSMFFLLILVSFIYALIGFNFFANHFFYDKVPPNGENICMNLL